MSKLGKVIAFQLKGLDGVVAVLGNTEKIPQKCVNKAAGKGMNVVRRSVKNRVPVATGELKRGIIRVGERSRVKGKKVYDLMFDPKKNDIFQKPIKNPGEAGGKSKHGYYPASMEYGFLTRSKGGGYRYVPGYHFMRDGAEEVSSAAKGEMIRVFNQEIDKEWSRR